MVLTIYLCVIFLVSNENTDKKKKNCVLAKIGVLAPVNNKISSQKNMFVIQRWRVPQAVTNSCRESMNTR